MSILSFVQQHFGFKDVHWEITDSLLHTNRGLKKVLLWDDYDLADWHSRWRYDLSSIDFVYIDRMIISQSGQLILRYGNQWLTCHDASRSYFSVKGNEEDWGKFIGLLLSKSTHHQNQRNHTSSHPLKNLDEGLASLRSLKEAKWEASFNILIKCLPSAKKRLKHSTTLADETVGYGLPFVPEFPNPTQVKELFGRLFWEPGQTQPTLGFHSFIEFLGQWLKNADEKRMFQLLDHIDTYYELSGENGNRLLSDLLYPSEWLACLRVLEGEEDTETIQDILTQFKKQWDQKSRLLAVFYQWLEGKRKQVAK